MKEGHYYILFKFKTMKYYNFCWSEYSEGRNFITLWTLFQMLIFILLYLANGKWDFIQLWYPVNADTHIQGCAEVQDSVCCSGETGFSLHF